MALLEKWKTCVDQKQICGALLTDLSKAFDCLPHDLIIAKPIFFTQPRIKSVNHGSESLSSLGPKIWELVPLEMRDINSLLKFKEEIKKWAPKNCPCRLCKKFIQHVGYI